MVLGYARDERRRSRCASSESFTLSGRCANSMLIALQKEGIAVVATDDQVDGLSYSRAYLQSGPAVVLHIGKDSVLPDSISKFQLSVLQV